MRVSRLAAVVALFSAAVLAQAPSGRQERDLKVEKDAPAATAEPAARGIPRGYALVVGIASYANLDAKFQLRFTERDADAIYSILISPEGGNFPAENVHRLTGATATLANLRRELEEWLPSVAREQDRVVVYFAGHGFIVDGRGYLAPSDFDARRAADSGYPMDAFGAAFAKIKATWKVLLTDACHSGAISPDDNEHLNRRIRSLDTSVFSLTASRDRERSFESPEWGGGHGIFTYYVVKGLEGSADESGDGAVTADELGEYVRRNVREATRAEQNPTFERASFDKEMLLAYNPTTVKTGAAPTAREGTLIIEVNMDGTEVFVDGRSAGVVNKGAPLRLPGLSPGTHTVKAVRLGYEPDGPREEIVYPGQERTITFRILIPRRQKRASEDLFEEGLSKYQRAGGPADYRKAAELFTRALATDPSHSSAALYLARSERALFDEESAGKSFRRAIEIDPDFMEARVAYAGLLIDTGNTDEAIRQLTRVIARQPKHDIAHYLLAQAFRMKERYKESIEAARASIRLEPKNADAHLWLADSLRLSGEYAGAVPEYQEYLRLSNFDSGLKGSLSYHVLGNLIGFGRKSRGGQTDMWKESRSLAYFGLCDSERKLARFDQAIAYCHKSLSFDSQEPYTHFALAVCYARKAVESGEIGLLPAARKHFETMLAINPDLSEAALARQNIVNIDAMLAAK